jgi:tetratricopeptide (TPR) repeat protein
MRTGSSMKKTSVQILRETIPPTELTWLISALRQDELVWQFLEEEENTRKAVQVVGDAPGKWNPGVLSLVALNLEPESPLELAAGLAKNWQKSIEPGLRQQTADALQATSFGESIKPTNLAKAGLLALALRESRRLAGTWNGFGDELRRLAPACENNELELLACWKTPLACLFGLIPHPLDMIRALIKDDQLDANLHLAVHGLLSAPHPPGEQAELVKELVSGLPIEKALVLSLTLSERQPSLKKELAASLLEQAQALIRPGSKSSDGTPLTPLQQLAELRSLLLAAETHQMAGDDEQVRGLLARAEEATMELQASLEARQGDTASLAGDHEDAARRWQKAAGLSPRSRSLYQAKSSKALMDAGQVDEAREQLVQLEEGRETDLVLTEDLFTSRLSLLQLALEKQDTETALQLAKKLADQLRLASPGAVRASLNQISNFAAILNQIDLYEAAAEAARIGLALRPQDSSLLSLLGEVSDRLGQYSQALRATEIAVALEPENRSLRGRLADIMDRAGQWAAALNERQALIAEAAPEEVTPVDIYKLATSALHAGEPEKAVEACQQIVAETGGQVPPAEVHWLYGEALARLGSLQEAQEQFNAAIEMDPTFALPWLALARLQKEAGEAARALETLRSAMLSSPDSPEIHLTLGIAYLEDWEERGHPSPAQALAFFQQAQRLAKSQPPYQELDLQIAMHLGSTLAHLGHFGEARLVYEPAYHSRPDYPGLAYAYSQTLLALEDPRAAIPALEQVVKTQPDDYLPYLEYARCLLAVSEKPQEAVVLLRHVLEVSPQTTDAHVMLAEALEKAGEMNEAFQAYQQALETNPDAKSGLRGRLSFGLGRVALALQDTDTALAALEEAAASSPEDPQIYRCLSEAYYQADLFQKSIQSARDAVRLDRNHLDTLEWFARRAIVWFQNHPSDAKEQTVQDGIPWSVHLQARAEALDAAGRALTLAPDRPDLIVLLGRLQFYAGDISDAHDSLIRVSQQEGAQVEDLEQAAVLLINLDDYANAIVCLEKALQIQESRDQARQSFKADRIRLLRLLLDAHRQGGDSEAALGVLTQALELSPNEASLLVVKASLLLDASQPLEAVSCLNQAAEIDPASCEIQALRLQAAAVLRSIGEAVLALEQVSQVLESCKEHIHEDFDMAARIAAADLTRGLLQPKQALILLGVPPVLEPGRLDDEQESFDYPPDLLEFLCLQGEMALELGDENTANDALAYARRVKYAAHPQEIDKTRLRLKALEARLQARADDTENGLNILQSALAIETWEVPAEAAREGGPNSAGINIGALNQKNAFDLMTANLLAVGEAAVEFGLWDLALFVLRRAGETAPSEPLPFFKLSRALVLRAEAYNLCSDLEAVQHSPGASSLAEYTIKSFENALETAFSLLEQWGASTNQNLGAAREQLECWKTRGLATFRPSIEEGLRSETYLPSAEAIAAWISAIRHKAAVMEDPNLKNTTLSAVTTTAIQAARIHPQNPFVLAQLALTLVLKPDTLPDALRAARQSLRSSKADRKFMVDSPLPTPRDQAAIFNALLARVAHTGSENALVGEAIQSALEAWPEEPRWHALAAENFRKTGETAAAIAHLEQARALEPRHMQHYLALGEAYLAQSPSSLTPKNGAASGLDQAIKTLEQASSFAQDNLPAWLALARTYLHAGQIDKAASCAEKALSLDPGNPESQLLVGEISLNRGYFQEAYDRIQTAAELSGDPAGWLLKPPAVLLLSRTLDGLNRTSEAQAYLEKAIPLAADPLPLLLEEVAILDRTQGADRSLDLLNDLALRYPDEPRVLAPLAFRLGEAGQLSEAVRFAQKALQMSTLITDESRSLAVIDQARVHLLLGRLMRQSGQLDQAVHHLNEAIQQAPESIEGYLELGTTLQERRQHPKALQMYQQATRIAPRDPRPYHQAGLALKESKDYMGAESMLRRAAELAPEDLIIHRQLGAVVALNLVHNRRRRSAEE